MDFSQVEGDDASLSNSDVSVSSSDLVINVKLKNLTKLYQSLQGELTSTLHAFADSFTDLFE